MKGIDIYSGQGNVDFNAVKAAGVEVVYIKATEGVTYTDPTYRDFYNKARAAGLKVGFYHFLRANNPVNEAQHFLNVVAGLHADCKYMIDCEIALGQSASQIQNNVVQFANYLKGKGLDVGLYTYTSFYKENNLQAANLPLWIAEYGVGRPNINVGYAGFQYSEMGSISGISGHVDLDEFGESILIGNSSSNVVQAPVQAANDTIKTIQQDLNTLLKRGLAVDGIEGSLTITAIKDFQKIMGLSVDGIVGNHTWSAMEQIFARPEDGISYQHMEYATRYIQHRCGITPDGIFGLHTKIAVQNWQAKHGLVADGIVGSATWSRLLDENV